MINEFKAMLKLVQVKWFIAILAVTLAGLSVLSQNAIHSIQQQKDGNRYAQYFTKEYGAITESTSLLEGQTLKLTGVESDQFVHLSDDSIFGFVNKFALVDSAGSIAIARGEYVISGLAIESEELTIYDCWLPCEIVVTTNVANAHSPEFLHVEKSEGLTIFQLWAYGESILPKAFAIAMLMVCVVISLTVFNFPREYE